MAGFVEQATLKVNDQSSAAIRKINAELRKLEHTAKSLKNINVNLRVNTSGLQAANKQLNTLAHNMSRLRGQTLNLRVNATGLTQAQAQIARLRQQASQPITVNTRGTGGGRGAAGAGPGVRQTGTRHQYGNFSVGRGAASVVIGGTAYAVAANVARSAVHGVVSTEDARIRLLQSGFDKGRTDQRTPDTDLLMAMARKAQEEFSRIPAAQIANAAVEQLQSIRANKGTFDDYQHALKRIASNATIMGMTFKDPLQGAEGARQLERMSQILGHDVDRVKIKEVQEAAMRAIIGTGGEMKPEEMVRVLQQLGPSISKTMSPQALTDIMMIRDEGGRASTANWRMAVQDLGRDSLNKRDKAAMAKYNLRKRHGFADPAVVTEAATDLVGFTERRIVPMLEKAGLANASSAEIATFLDEQRGFTTTGARAFTDIVTSLRGGDLQRARAVAAAANLDPHLGDRTFRGGSERLKASFETAMGRAFDKSGGAFADAITPFALSMDRAGKAAEKSDYVGAAAEMTKGIAGLMGGPAGAMLTAMSAGQAIRTLLDPTASPFEKGVAMLSTAAQALLTAAGAMMNYFGGGDPNQDLAHLQQLDQNAPAQMESLIKQRDAAQAAVDKDPSVKNRTRLANINRAIVGAENQQRDVQRQIPLAQARVDALRQEQADLKAQEAAEMERLQRESTLGPGAQGPIPTAPVAAGPISAETVKALQQLSAGGGLAGVKSITALLKALNQPTSVKAREQLATSLGYTGPLGGSAAMNTFLLNFFRKLATTPPPDPAAIPPPPPPAPVVTEPPPAVTEEPAPVVVEPPKEPTEVVAPTPLQVVPPPGGTLPGGGPRLIRPGEGGLPGPGGIRPPLRPFSDLIDMGPAKLEFAGLFTSGASTIAASGTEVGSNAAGELDGRAGAIGGAIGRAAASIISQATVNIQIPGQGAPSQGNRGDVPVPA